MRCISLLFTNLLFTYGRRIAGNGNVMDDARTTYEWCWKDDVKLWVLGLSCRISTETLQVPTLLGWLGTWATKQVMLVDCSHWIFVFAGANNKYHFAKPASAQHAAEILGTTPEELSRAIFSLGQTSQSLSPAYRLPAASTLLTGSCIMMGLAALYGNLLFSSVHFSLAMFCMHLLQPVAVTPAWSDLGRSNVFSLWKSCPNVTEGLWNDESNSVDHNINHQTTQFCKCLDLLIGTRKGPSIPDPAFTLEQLCNRLKMYGSIRLERIVMTA